MTASKTSVYFPGLNGLRFFAAFAVIITHIELLKGQFGILNYWDNPLINVFGVWGVEFFFVLSGFLITYLLLVERKNHGKISVKGFYMRRVLRIWPLYYLLVIVGFFVLPQFESLHINYLQDAFETNFWGMLVAYVVIFPNVATSLYPAVPHIGQLWSIGVEEQFYIVWPWLMRSKIPKELLMVGIVVLFVGIKAVLLLLNQVYPESTALDVVMQLLVTMKFECMAIGALGAYYLYQKNEQILRILKHPVVYVLAFAVAPAQLYLAPEQFQDAYFLLNAVSFLIIILNVSTSSKSNRWLENRVFNYLGKISYGIYMYHMMIIAMVLSLLKGWTDPMQPTLWWNVLIYATVLVLTFAVAGFSYAYFESFFLNLKKKFTRN